MSIPTVSIIIPNFNHAPYLRQRLDSIFNQTFQDFEVIILDDCSTDNSKEIIEEYRHRPQVSHIVYNKTNSGSPFKQWSKGFDLAKGEYIWIAESDDWAELNFLEEMLPILNNDKSLSFAYCNSFMEDGQKNPLTRNIFNKTKKISCHDMIKHLCWGCCVYNASSVVFRKVNLLKTPCDYQKYSSSGDYLFWIYQSEFGDVYYNFKALNHYRIHQTNISTIKDVSGDASIEDYTIYLYLKKKGYYSFFEKRAFILAQLENLHSKAQFISNKKKLNEISLLYKKEIYSTTLSKLLVKAGTFLWNLLKDAKKDNL